MPGHDSFIEVPNDISNFGSRDGAEIPHEDAFAKSLTHTPTTATMKTQTFYGVVLYDFVAERSNELDAKAGDSILVGAQSDDREWFIAKSIGRLGPGLIPVAFVEVRDLATGKLIPDIGAHLPSIAQTAPTQPYDKQQLSNWRQTPILPQADGLLLSANVVSFHFEMDECWFRVHALYQPFDPSGSTLPPAKESVLFRTYGDFFEHQIALLDTFPREAGRESGHPRIIPFLPGPANEIHDAFCSMRRRELDGYLCRLCNLNRTTARYILEYNLTRKFLRNKPGDLGGYKEPQYDRMADVGWYEPSEEPVPVSIDGHDPPLV